MSLHIVEGHRGGFDFYRGGVHVGRAADGAISWWTFDSANDAYRAAVAAHDALAVWFARQRRTDLPPRNDGTLRARRDGADTQLALGDLPVGRVIPPDETDRPWSRGYGFELPLPPGLWSRGVIGAARVIDAVLQRRAAPAPAHRTTHGAAESTLSS